tara:strand:+ start:194 stop:301 length:108 start_codon:yes stop_codon:yes gene_type:complete
MDCGATSLVLLNTGTAVINVLKFGMTERKEMKINV